MAISNGKVVLYLRQTKSKFYLNNFIYFLKRNVQHYLQLLLTTLKILDRTLMVYFRASLLRYFLISQNKSLHQLKIKLKIRRA